ncbi:MAG: hypothetical protein WCP19_11260 [Chloroflexota bacterium]
MIRKPWLILLLCCSALITGFLLKDVVEQLIILPAAYLLWMLGILYQYIPQPILWVIFILIMSFLVMGPFLEQLKKAEFQDLKHRYTQGPVEELAGQIQHKQDGIYFKWQIARLLAQAAMDIQELRYHNRTRKLDYGTDSADPRVKAYLEAGMNTSFSDYPNPAFNLSKLIAGLFWKKAATNLQNYKTDQTRKFPIDHDIEPVIAYLESKMENNDDYKRA